MDSNQGDHRVNDGQIVSVNIGTPRPISYRGRRVMTSIWKTPVEGPVMVQGVNLVGDQQSDLSAHGGPDKAVYAYAVEDLDWWSGELEQRLEPGAFGENLTLRGVPVSQSVIGERWSVGDAEVEVAQPRMPCFKLGVRMGSQRFVKQFTRANRPGAYLRIIREGPVAAGDGVRIIRRPAHGLTIADVARVRTGDHANLGRLLEADELPAKLHAWAREQFAHRSGHATEG